MATYLWKAMRKGLNSHHGTKRWKIGKWYKVKGELEMCENGFHASEKIIDAMGYVPMEILAKVEVRGAGITRADKQCWSEMQIVRAWKWHKEDSVALSIYCAGLVLENFEKKCPDDKRPREAIAAARRRSSRGSTRRRRSATSTWAAACR